VGKRSNPDQPTKTKRSRLIQSSRTSNQPRCEMGGERVEEAITSVINLTYLVYITLQK